MKRGMRTSGGRRFGRVLVLAALTVAGAACDWWEDPSPDTASFAVMEGEGEYQVLLSTVFVVGFTDAGDTQVELIRSDTLTVTTPFLEEVDIRGDQRFFVRVLAADGSTPTTPVRLTVDLDDENRFDRRAEATEEPILFVYQLNGQVFTDDVLVF